MEKAVFRAADRAVYMAVKRAVEGGDVMEKPIPTCWGSWGVKYEGR
jgi:hypothetical protein